MATIATRPPCDAGVILSAPECVPVSPAVGRWVLAATILGSSMAFIEGTVVNVALPVLQLDLGATAADVQWVVQSYSLVLASLILVGGSLGDRFGRRRRRRGTHGSPCRCPTPPPRAGRPRAPRRTS